MENKALEKINNESHGEFPAPTAPEYSAHQKDYSQSQDDPIKQPINGGETSTGPPITTQPVSQNMSFPQPIPNCPPGLEYLCLVDKLNINRTPGRSELELGKVDTNRHLITNINGDKIYNASEISTSCQRNWCLACREFETKIFDNFGNEVMHFYRPLKYGECCCCCPCCFSSIEISSPPGTLIGFVQQTWSIFYPRFVVKNALGDIVLRLNGPVFEAACCGDPTYQILSIDGKTKLGKIYKKNFGSCYQRYNDQNAFGIEFPMDLDVRMKACIFGACFLIEMMYFEYMGKSRDMPCTAYRY